VENVYCALRTDYLYKTDNCYFSKVKEIRCGQVQTNGGLLQTRPLFVTFGETLN